MIKIIETINMSPFNKQGDVELPRILMSSKNKKIFFLGILVYNKNYIENRVNQA